MSKLKLKPAEIVTPETALVEKVAGELAAVWFETARSSGHIIKGYGNNVRKFARENLESFIPHALKHLMEMLNNPSTPPDQKMMIYDAIMKRANDPEARALFPSNTENDKHLNNFELPKDFLENHFPEFIDQKYLKKRMN